jgi:hypothetical protein
VMMMTQPASAAGALPCVDIHLDEFVMAGALSVPFAGAQDLPARPADAAVPGFAPGRPPLSDEEDEDSLDLDDGDDDDDDEDEDEEDEDEEGDDDEDDDEEEDEDEDDEEEDDDDKK